MTSCGKTRFFSFLFNTLLQFLFIPTFIGSTCSGLQVTASTGGFALFMVVLVVGVLVVNLKSACR